MQTRVMILDNDKDFIKVINLTLPHYYEGEYYATHDVNDLLDRIEPNCNYVLVLDYNLEYSITGVTVFNKAKEKQPVIQAIYMTNQLSLPMLLDVVGTRWGCMVLEKTDTNFAEELANQIKISIEDLKVKYGSVLKLSEMEKNMRRNAEEMLKIIEKR